MRLASPEWLALLPLIAVVLWYRQRRRHRPAVSFSSVEGLRRLPRTLAQRAKKLLPFLEGLGLVLLVLAMARPQSGRTDSVITSEGIAIQLVIDKSGSMREGDLDPDPWDRQTLTRLDVVKEVVRDFVDEDGDLPGRPDDLLGLISFAGFVQTHAPMTLDHQAFLKVLGTVRMPELTRAQQQDPRFREVTATAMGDALVTAVARLADIRAESRVIVLLSDGRSNIGEASPQLGAQAAAAAGIKVYTIGVGTRRGGLDEPTLQEVAATTGGQYFNARDADALRRIYAEIDRLERSELPARSYTRWKEQFHWMLLVGVGLVVLHQLLVTTRFRSLP